MLTKKIMANVATLLGRRRDLVVTQLVLLVRQVQIQLYSVAEFMLA